MSLGRSNAVGENLASGAAPRRRGWMELKMQPKVYANSRSRGVPAPAPNTQHPQELQTKVREDFTIKAKVPTGTLTFKTL